MESNKMQQIDTGIWKYWNSFWNEIRKNFKETDSSKVKFERDTFVRLTKERTFLRWSSLTLFHLQKLIDPFLVLSFFYTLFRTKLSKIAVKKQTTFISTSPHPSPKHTHFERSTHQEHPRMHTLKSTFTTPKGEATKREIVYGVRSRCWNGW